MATRRRPLIAGNWKMNGLRRPGLREARLLAARMKDLRRPQCDVLVCPPATLLAPLQALLKGGRITLGGQDCHAAASGANTGDVSAEMLKDCGCRYVIVGHSERRADHGETSKQVGAKAAAAHRAGLIAIVCVGETLAERRTGKARDVVGRQLRDSLPQDCTAGNVVVAYEPVWAIGTGRTPTPADVAEMHGFIRGRLRRRFAIEAEGIRVLYGGSVKASNAAELMAVDNVDGALVGGASLKATDFWPIVRTVV